MGAFSTIQQDEKPVLHFAFQLREKKTITSPTMRSSMDVLIVVLVVLAVSSSSVHGFLGDKNHSYPCLQGPKCEGEKIHTFGSLHGKAVCCRNGDAIHLTSGFSLSKTPDAGGQVESSSVNGTAVNGTDSVNGTNGTVFISENDTIRGLSFVEGAECRCYAVDATNLKKYISKQIEKITKSLWSSMRSIFAFGP